MNKIILGTLFIWSLIFTSCDAFLGAQEPQAVLDDEQVANPAYVDNLVISAYAIFISAEDINSSFSMRAFCLLRL